LSLALPFLLYLVYWAYTSILWHRKYRLPPQVPGLPILGNSLQVPFPSGMWLKGLADQYGEM